MKAITKEKRRQWLWFIGLWCAGPACMLMLDLLIRFGFSLMASR